MILNGCINQESTDFVTIQFDTLGGSHVDTQVVEEGERLSLPRTTKEGHTLIGWYISFNDGETFDERWNFTTSTASHDLTLYARWRVNQYDVVFQSEGTNFDLQTLDFDTKIVVVAANSGFFLYDETGYIYVRDTQFWGANNPNIKVGDSWTFVGVRDLFRGLPHIGDLTSFGKSTDTFADEVNQGFITLQDIKDGNIIPGAKYYIYGTATLIEGRFTDYRIQTGDVFVQLHHNTNNSAIADFEGQEIALEVRPFHWDFSTPFVTYTLTADDVITAPLTVTQALEEEKGSRIVVYGVVVSIDPHTNGFFIQDEDGTAIYVGNFTSNELKSLVKVGDLVWVSGVRDTFDRFGNIQNQVWTASLVAVVHSDQEVFVFEGFTLDQIISEYPESDSKRFIVEDVTIDFYDNTFHVFLNNSDDDLEIQITFDIRQVAGGWDPEDYPEGTVLTLAFTTQRIHFNNYRVVDVEIIPED